MKQIIQIFIIGLLGFSMIGCHGCKEPVVDPCEGVEEVTADFKMEYSMGYNEDERWFDADTVLEITRVRFSAEGNYDSIKWKVGLDPREFVEKKFSLRFDDSGSVQVRMIAYRAPNVSCFPDDDGVDTLIKQLVIVPDSMSLVLGVFEGYFLSEPDSLFTMEIRQLNDVTWTPEFPKGCVKDPYFQGGMWSAYRRLFSRGESGHCQGAMPYLWGVYEKDTLKIEYKYLISSEKYEDTFIGIKK